MALKVKAVERNIKFTKDENDPGVWRYVMQPDLYIALNQAKVIKEAALRSGAARQECGKGRGCEDLADLNPSHYLHPYSGPEGRAGQHLDSDYLLRPQR